MTRVSRRSWARWAVALIAAATLATGCLSPTLPLPPPSQPTVEGPDPQGNVRLTGYVLSGSEAIADNIRTGRGVTQITGADGRYDLTLGAQIGDEIEFSYVDGTDRSPSIIVAIH